MGMTAHDLVIPAKAGIQFLAIGQTINLQYFLKVAYCKGLKY
ncbi:MAG: hypothetical protein QG641_467 [Candidatus Poribacteria bacterium]|nr:hypothetical protein [Candidatus Poribacteria bacterium]MDQ1327187.1 hypothetical protein [Candidatus Poribacteria bacterium]